jgi:hypothetical protein
MVKTQHKEEEGQGDVATLDKPAPDGKAEVTPLANRTLTTNSQKSAGGIVNFASGVWVSDAGSTGVAMTFTCGFNPRYVQFVNITDLIIDEWFDGMAADNSLHQVAAGTLTLAGSGGITLVDKGFSVAAGLVPASKTGYWQAVG